MSGATREIEVKGVVADLASAIERARAAGAMLTFKGVLEDRRYDDARRTLMRRDTVLRLRVERDEAGVRAQVDCKGATGSLAGFKVREERSVKIDDPATFAEMLGVLGYVVVREIDREIDQFDLNGTMIRFERYPRMDTLVEIEGTPDGIGAAIEALGMARGSSNAGRLADFVREFERRTGLRAAVSNRELSGDYTLSDERAI